MLIWRIGTWTKSFLQIEFSLKNIQTSFQCHIYKHTFHLHLFLIFEYLSILWLSNNENFINKIHSKFYKIYLLYVLVITCLWPPLSELIIFNFTGQMVNHRLFPTSFDQVTRHDPKRTARHTIGWLENTVWLQLLFNRLIVCALVILYIQWVSTIQCCTAWNHQIENILLFTICDFFYEWKRKTLSFIHSIHNAFKYLKGLVFKICKLPSQSSNPHNKHLQNTFSGICCRLLMHQNHLQLLVS